MLLLIPSFLGWAEAIFKGKALPGALLDGSKYSSSLDFPVHQTHLNLCYGFITKLTQVF